MVTRIVIGILVLTAVTCAMIFVVFPMIGVNSIQQIPYQPETYSVAQVQENPKSIHSSEIPGNQVSGNSLSEHNNAANTTDTIKNSTSVTTNELIGRLLAEKQPSVLEGLIQEIKKKDSREAVNALIEKIRQTNGMLMIKRLVMVDSVAHQENHWQLSIMRKYLVIYNQKYKHLAQKQAMEAEAEMEITMQKVAMVVMVEIPQMLKFKDTLRQ